MIAPHLPPPTCDLKTRRALQSLPWLIFILFTAALTSIAVTLATLVWLAPSYIPDQLVTIIRKRSETPAAALDAIVINKVRPRLWHIYDKRQKIGGRFYRDNEVKLSAVMFSSDGWAVMYAPNYRPGLERFWEAFNYQGVAHAVERVFLDPVSGLTYLKFRGDGFPFVSFADWGKIGPGSRVWLLASGGWREQRLDEPVTEAVAGPVSIWQPMVFYGVRESFAEGAAVINDVGQLVGFVGPGKKLIFGWLIDNQYAAVLAQGQTSYQAVSWRGHLVEGFARSDSGERRLTGFYVTASPTKSASSTVGAGDVVTRVQNKPVEAANLARQILFAPDSFFVTIFRHGQEVQIEVKKEAIK